LASCSAISTSVTRPVEKAVDETRQIVFLDGAGPASFASQYWADGRDRRAQPRRRRWLFRKRVV
jgi:hypothetical protein